MGKKRKASARAVEERSNLAFEDPGPKLHVRSYEDVADSEDEFLLQRDNILLDEGPEAKRRRKIGEEEALLEVSDEEVLALPESEGSEDDISISEEDEDGDISLLQASASRIADDGDERERDEDEDDEYGGWGDSRDAYYGADTIDTEQAALEEEAEAKRLQQKQLQSMNEADFGFEDEFGEEQVDNVVDGMEEDVVTEVLPELQVSEDMSQEQSLKVLRQRYPEFEPIAKEFLEMQSAFEHVKQQAHRAKEFLELRGKVLPNSTPSRSHPAILKYHALATNLGVVAMYFAILTSTANSTGTAIAKAPAELRDHAIMDNLLKSRQLWTSIKDLGYPDIDDEIEALTKRAASEENAAKVKAARAEVAVALAQIPKPKKKSKARRAAEAAAATEEAARVERMRNLEADLATLSAPASTSKRAVKATKRVASRVTIPMAEEDSDFGDETELNARDLAEKAQRKKTLRFYTSQITQKSNKRGAAGRDAGGDMDIPHRERFRERQAKALEEAERHGKNTGRSSQDPDEIGHGDDTMAQMTGIRGGDVDDEDYYDLVAARSKQKKADKAAAAQAYARAQREGGKVIEEETVGDDGKRTVTYAIEKNKGLTPFRRKEVRNPRVKKRMKYKEKQKKLGSVRQVYKGEGKGVYGGELTGIKTGLVKSVKL